jgi:hypothetical protein
VHLVRSARVVALPLSPTLLQSCPRALRLAAQEPIRTERKQQDSKHDRVAKALIRMPRRVGVLVSRHLLDPYASLATKKKKW